MCFRYTYNYLKSIQQNELKYKIAKIKIFPHRLRFCQYIFKFMYKIS